MPPSYKRTLWSLSLCVRDAVPAHRFGGALGAVMMVAWAGMASSSYVGGRLFDATLSYNLSFILEGVAGTLNLMVLALINFRQRTVCSGQSAHSRTHSRRSR
jgi:hypothetical protein